MLILFAISACKSNSKDESAFSFLESTPTPTPTPASCAITSSSPESDALTVASGDTNATTFAVITTGTSCSVEFKLNGAVVGSSSVLYVIPASQLNAGTNTLIATAGGQTRTWTITKNTPPVCATQNPAATGNTVAVGASLALAGTATDANAHALTYSWKLDGVSAAPLFSAITSTAGGSNATFTPTAAETGAHTLSMQISDGYDTTSCSWSTTITNSAALSVSCTPTDNPVVITSAGVNSSRTFTATASGGTGSLHYSWTLNGAPTGATSNEVTYSAAGLSAGNYTLVATVADDDSHSDTCTINIKRNAPPVCSVTTPSNATTKKTYYGSILPMQVSCTDANTDTITYSWKLDGYPNAILTSGTASSNLNPALNQLYLGSHTVDMLASDGNETDSKSWTIEINRFSDACNNLAAGKICTLVGIPGIGDNLRPADDITAQRIRPRLLTTETVGGIDNLIISDDMSHVVCYYNRTAGTLSRFGFSIGAGKYKCILGNGQAGLNLVATGTAFKLSTPMGVSINSTGPNLFVSDYSNQRVYWIDNDGNVTVILGDGGTATNINGTNVLGTAVSCYSPYGNAYDPVNKRLYVACFSNNTIRYVDVDSASPSYLKTFLVVQSGGPAAGATGDNTAGGTGAGFAYTYSPRTMKTDGLGNIFWSEACLAGGGGLAGKGSLIRVYSPAGGTFYGTVVAANNVKTVAGAVPPVNTACLYNAGTGAGLTAISIIDPFDFALDPDREGIYVGDRSNQRVHYLNNSGAAVTLGGTAINNKYAGIVLGTGTAGFNSNGVVGNITRIYTPEGMVSLNGVLYFSDYSNYRLRSMDVSTANGVVSAVVGQGYGKWGYVGDGDIGAQDVYMYYPFNLAVDTASRKLYYGDYSNYRVKSIDLITGTVGTLVGKTSGPYGSDPDTRSNVGTVPGAMAFLNNNVIYADWGSAGLNQPCQIRGVNATAATISVFGNSILSDMVKNIAGNYALGCSLTKVNADYNNVNAETVQIYQTEGLVPAVDNSGDPILYAVQPDMHCVLKLSNSGGVPKFNVALGTCSTQGNAANNVTIANTLLAGSFRYPKGACQDPENPTNIFIIDQWNQGTQVIRYCNFSASDVSVFQTTITAGYCKILISVGSTPYLNSCAAYSNQFCYSAGYFNNTNAGDHNIACRDRTQPVAASPTLRCGSDFGNPAKGGGPLSTEQEGMTCTSATLAAPHGIVFDGDGNLYFSERNNNQIRMVKKWW